MKVDLSIEHCRIIKKMLFNEDLSDKELHQLQHIYAAIERSESEHRLSMFKERMRTDRAHRRKGL